MTDSPDTRPMERERQLKDDTAFRERMLDVTARLEENTDHIREQMTEHATEDRQEFARIHRQLRKQNRRIRGMGQQVTQTVNTSKYNWGMIWTWCSAVIGVIGALWAIYTQVSK